jgi:hypothetical protein
LSNNFILILIIIVGVPALITLSGFAGVFLCNKINFLKKNLYSENLLWVIFFIYYFFQIAFKPNVDFINSLGVAFGYFLISFIAAIIYSIIRNKNKTKKIDEKFYYFFFGVSFLSIISTIVTIYRGKF